MGVIILKKLKYEKGSVLLESIVALSVISLVILTLIPFQINIQQLLLDRKNEVEAWRYAQDFVRQGVGDKQAQDSGQRTSNGSQLFAAWNGNSLTIMNYSQEVILIEYSFY